MIAGEITLSLKSIPFFCPSFFCHPYHTLAGVATNASFTSQSEVCRFCSASADNPAPRGILELRLGTAGFASQTV